MTDVISLWWPLALSNHPVVGVLPKLEAFQVGGLSQWCKDVFLFFSFFFFKHNQKCFLQLHPHLSVEHVIALLFSVNQVVSKHFCSDALTDPGQAKEAQALCCGHKLLVTGIGNTCAAPLSLDWPSLEGQCLSCTACLSLSPYGLHFLIAFNSVEGWGRELKQPKLGRGEHWKNLES